MSVIILFIATTLTADPVVLDRPALKLATGTAYRDALQHDVSATWDNLDFRAVLWELQANRGVAVLLDRHIDPNAIYPVRLSGESLRDGFIQLASHANAAAGFPEHVVYIGPPDLAKWVCTAVEQAESKLADKALQITERRQAELSKRRTVQWQDLSTPREILQQVVAPYRLDIDGLDNVPHDLLASATLPQVTVAEALTLVLMQFDLGWDWQPGGRGVKIKPWEPPPLLERRYTPRGKELGEAQKIWAAALPEAHVRSDGRELVVTGRAEDQALAQILRTTGTLPKHTATKPPPTPLRKRVFTATIQRIPVRAVMQDLEQKGVTFIYDQAALKAAGVSLDEPISLEVNKADADAYLKAIFGPLGVGFEIDGVTVRLSVR